MNITRVAFSEGSSLHDGWVYTVMEKLTTGRIEAVITAITGLPLLEPASGQTCSLLEVEAEYFRRDAERMRYPLFRA